MAAPLHFRVYPESRTKKLYFDVHTFRSRQRMFRFYRLTTRLRKCNFRAVVVSWDSHGPCLGQILFGPNALTASIAAHEMTHAGMTWAFETGVNVLRPRGEERLAQAVGNMAAQFWRRFEKTAKDRKVK